MFLVHEILPDLKHTSPSTHVGPGGPFGKILFNPSESRPKYKYNDTM